MFSTASQAIQGYQLLSQTFEFREDVLRAARLDQIKQARRPAKKNAARRPETAEQRAEKLKDIDSHRIGWDEFCGKLGVARKALVEGLTAAEAARRNSEYGDNALSERKKTPWWAKLAHEFTSFFSLLLWAGAAMSFIVYVLDPADVSNLYLCVVLVLVVIVSGLVTFFQNAKSESIMEGFRNFIPQQSTVIRDGHEQSVLSVKLVPGDLVQIREGQRIPADIRIVSSNEMRVDNSSLTGETEPLLRGEVCDQPARLLETQNVAFFGTLCKQGEGRGVVFSIGDNTIIGQIAMLADTARAGKSPLRQELDRFIVMITAIAFTFGAVFFFCGFLLKYTAIQNLVFAIGIVVANVPEGMLATITITLSVAAHRLSRHSVLVKNLESVETLGATSCICSDKTGTLTQNVMTVQNLWYGLSIRAGDNLEKRGADFGYAWRVGEPDFDALHRSAVLNSTAVFDSSLPPRETAKLERLREERPTAYAEANANALKEWATRLETLPYYQRETIGDASETALIKFFQPIADVEAMRAAHCLALQVDGSPARVPFGSSHKFALTCYQEESDGYAFVAYLKGAPEVVWRQCAYLLINGREISIDDEIARKFEEANRTFARNGERVLGFARLLLPRADFPSNHRFCFKDPHSLGLPHRFAFIGLVSLADPPRESVPLAIAKCKTSGIKVIMVTGDQRLTAASIARQIGIIDGRSSLDIAEEEGCSYDEAVERADAIVVDGEMLTLAAVEDEGLPESERGRRLEGWLKKPQVVFARTSPAQKLYIVKGCQRLGYVVAVTGDGVNDSPAIKQADIGIAMGITGSDVAKDAAQMILLNDDFAAIVVGVEEGRKIFDNLKKAITYILTSNIPELLPFLCLVLFAIPLPLSTIEVLLIDIGTDMFPAASFAYERAELDIMTRKPRAAHEHLVTTRLLVLSYLQLGVILSAAAFVSYFLVMNQFGFTPSMLWGLVRMPYFPHNPTDRYDPTAPFLGNTNVQCDEFGVLRAIEIGGIGAEIDFSRQEHRNKLVGRTLDWLYAQDARQDVRMGFLLNDCGHGRAVPRFPVWPQCRLAQLSPLTGAPVCFTTEALKYAQASYFFTVVLGQLVNAMTCKTRVLPLCFQGLNNRMMLLGWATELVIVVLLAYSRLLNLILGVRDLVFLQAGFYGAFLIVGMLVFDELRKLLIRNFPSRPGVPNFFVRNTLT